MRSRCGGSLRSAGPSCLGEGRGTDELGDLGVGQQLREDHDVPEVELVADFRGPLLAFLRSFFVDFNVDGHEDIHWIGDRVTNFLEDGVKFVGVFFVLAEEGVELDAEVGGFDLVEESRMRGDVTFWTGQIIFWRRGRGRLLGADGFSGRVITLFFIFESWSKL